jgi:hypothetical protein
MKMALWQQIEPVLERVLATRGAQVLAIGGDTEVWVAGVAAVDGSLEIRTGDRGAKRGLRRKRIDRTALEALGLQRAFPDAWALGLEPAPLLARRGASLLEQALTHALGASHQARADVVFEQTGLISRDPGAPHREHLREAVAVCEPDAAIMVSAGRPSRNCLDLVLNGDVATVSVVDGDEREVPVHEAAAVADALLHEDLGVRQDAPLFVHFLLREAR